MYEVPAFEKLLGRAEEGSKSSNTAKKFLTNLAAGGPRRTDGEIKDNTRMRSLGLWKAAPP